VSQIARPKRIRFLFLTFIGQPPQMAMPKTSFLPNYCLS
jgi:hypothetical protein